MYTAEELASRFEVSPQTVYWYAKIGVIPPAKGRGRARRYGRDAYLALRAYQEKVYRPGNRLTAACFAEQRTDGRHLDGLRP